jgi:hypothetical protein
MTEILQSDDIDTQQANSLSSKHLETLELHGFFTWAQESTGRMPSVIQAHPAVKGTEFMKLIHSDPAAFIQSRLERLASGRRRRRLQNRDISGNSPQGTTPPSSSPKKAA